MFFIPKNIILAILFFYFNLSFAANSSLNNHKAIFEKSNGKRFALNSAADLIRKNGFVVELTEDLQVFEPYLSSKYPVYITTDSAFYTFYFLLQKSYCFVEMQNVIQLNKFVKAMHESLAKLATNCISKQRENYKIGLAIFEVAAQLLGEPLEIISGKKSKVEIEVERIQKSRSKEICTIVKRKLDYGSFKPSGIYAKKILSGYYRAFHWLNQMKFSAEDEHATTIAIILTTAFERSKEAQNTWKSLHDRWSYWLGPVDDLTMFDYLKILQRTAPKRKDLFSQEYLSTFFHELEALKDPLIRSEFVFENKPVKGLTILNTHYLPESELFWKTTAPNIPGRIYNSGAEMLLLMGGNNTGVDLLNEPAYITKKIVSLAKEIRERENAPYYQDFLSVLGKMLNEGHHSRIPYMRTKAWNLKNANTALSCWAMYRHLVTAHVKLPISLGGVHGKPRGFVEPYPEIFRFIGEKTKKILKLVSQPIGKEAKESFENIIKESKQNILDHQGLPTPDNPEELQKLAQAYTNLNDFANGAEILKSKLMTFVELMEKLAKKARPEQNGYLYEDNLLFDSYGETLLLMLGYTKTQRKFDDDVPVITTVCEYQIPNAVFQVGLGRPNRIYVLFPCKKKLVPCVGSVLSYRECILPLDARMDDSNWRKKTDIWKYRPAWNRSFVTDSVDYPLLLKIAQETGVLKRFLLR